MEQIRRDPFSRLAMGAIILQGLIVGKGPADGTYRVYLPNLLPTLDGSDTEVRETALDSKNILEMAKTGNYNVTESNSIIAGAESLIGMSDARYTKNDVVKVIFPDRDINNATILPFRPSGMNSGPSLGWVAVMATGFINKLTKGGGKKKKKKKAGEPNENTDVPATPENTYAMEIDAEKKRASLQTSKANGEKFAYQVVLDGETGVLNIKDSGGTHFQILSESKGILMGNDQGSAIGIIGNKIQITADEIEINGVNYKRSTTNDEIETSTIKTKATSSSHEYQSYKLQSSKAEIDINNSEIKGARAAINTTNITVGSSIIDGTQGTTMKMTKNQFGSSPLSYADDTGMHTGHQQTPLADGPAMVSALMKLATALDAKMPPSPGVSVGSVALDIQNILSKSALH